MTKNQMLLNMAIDAVNWGEGADFEMKELIHEGSHPYPDLIRKIYPERFKEKPAKDPNEDEDDDDEDNDEMYDDKLYSFIQGEISSLLEQLIIPFECPIWKAEQEEKARLAEIKRQKALKESYDKALANMKFDGKKCLVKLKFSGEVNGILKVLPKGTKKDPFRTYELVCETSGKTKNAFGEWQLGSIEEV